MAFPQKEELDSLAAEEDNSKCVKMWWNLMQERSYWFNSCSNTKKASSKIKWGTERFLRESYPKHFIRVDPKDHLDSKLIPPSHTKVY